MHCVQCDRDVPDGPFCTSCGARQGQAGAAADARRLDRFAANPSEPVMTFGVFSTLFPHLAHDAVNEFKWVFLGGIAALVILSLLGLITAAIILSAFLVPVLYLMYLYEVRIYRDAPIPIVGMTVGGGLILGAVTTFVANQLVVPLEEVRVTPFGTVVDVAGLTIGAVLLPLVMAILMPIPALLLRSRKGVSGTADGLVLGVAAGLGFSAAATIVRFAQVLTNSSIDTAIAGWVYPLLSIAIFAPLMAGSTAGLITAALWRRGRKGRMGRLEIGGVVLALGHVGRLRPGGSPADRVWHAAPAGPRLGDPVRRRGDRLPQDRPPRGPPRGGRQRRLRVHDMPQLPRGHHRGRVLPLLRNGSQRGPGVRERGSHRDRGRRKGGSLDAARVSRLRDHQP